LILPAGAILCSVAAASGYYAASRLLGRAPGFLAIMSMLVTSLLTWVAIYYIEYRLFTVKGTPVASVIGFGTFINSISRGASISVMGVRLGRIAGLGYPLALLDGIGFLIGGAQMIGIIARPIACNYCHRYLPAVSSEQAYGDAAALAREFESLKTLADDGQGGGCLARIARLSQQEANYKLSIDVSYCQPCQRQYYRLRLLKFVSPRWVPLKGYDKKNQVPSADVAVR
jgi:hypothetical protein